jgi:capsular polysaccharide biosynthesis protein
MLATQKLDGITGRGTMAVTERPRRTRDLDLDAEQEVEFRRYWNAVAARWWLPVLGLIAGIVGGYALAIGGGDVYRAEATLYLGQPFTPNGGAPVPGLATNPSTVSEIVHNDGVLDDVAERSGMNRSKLGANVSSRQVSPPAGRRAVVGTTPLIEISVTGQNARTTARAANLLAERVVSDVSPYVDDKIIAIQERITADERELAESQRRLDLAQAELDALLENRSLSATDRLIGVTTFNATIGSLVERRGLVTQDLLEAKQALSLAENVEKPSVVEQAAARKTTARSVGRSVVVGALIGLILGILAAILWEPASRRFSTA